MCIRDRPTVVWAFSSHYAPIRWISLNGLAGDQPYCSNFRNGFNQMPSVTLSIGLHLSMSLTKWHQSYKFKSWASPFLNIPIVFYRNIFSFRNLVYVLLLYSELLYNCQFEPLNELYECEMCRITTIKVFIKMAVELFTGVCTPL